MTVQTQSWELRGGLDLASPAMTIPAGRAIVAQNYSASLSGGYRRMDGYTLYDGKQTSSTVLAVKVSGSGDVLGVWEYKDVLYAFRNNAAGTACIMHKATTTGWVVVTTPTLAPDGKYDFATHNFTGSSATEKMYGADGKNKSFQFDGSTFTQLTTGMSDDKPTHVGVHKNHLFLSFAGGSLQHSGIGDPTAWTLNTGAGELGIGTEITNIESMRGDALVVSGEDTVSILYGSSSADWNLKSFSTEMGVVQGTAELIDSQLVWFNGRDVTSLQATQTYGDFSTASLSTPIAPFIDESRAAKVVGSSVNYSKSQYRLFFSDNTVVVATVVNNKVIGWTTWLLEHSPTALTEGYMGCSDGSVMKMDDGNSFAGLAIRSYMRLPFNAMRSPHRKKRFRKMFLELETGSTATLRMIADYDYGSGASPIANEVVITGSGGLWDIASWGAFAWSATVVSQAQASLSGSGRNVGVLIYHESATDPAFTVQGVRVNYSIRGLIR